MKTVGTDNTYTLKEKNGVAVLEEETVEIEVRLPQQLAKWLQLSASVSGVAAEEILQRIIADKVLNVL